MALPLLWRISFFAQWHLLQFRDLSHDYILITSPLPVLDSSLKNDGHSYVGSPYSVLGIIHLVFLFYLLSSKEHINVSNRFCCLGGIFCLLAFNSLFPILLCCFFFSYFISHSAFWKQRISFWPIFPFFWNAFIHIFLILCIFPFYVGESLSLYPWIKNGLATPINSMGALPCTLFLSPSICPVSGGYIFTSLVQ